MKKENSTSPCQHISIANSKLGEVLVCPDCGVVHMSLQSISMRFDAEAFKVLSRMLAKAQHILDSASQQITPQNDISEYDYGNEMSQRKMH